MKPRKKIQLGKGKKKLERTELTCHIHNPDNKTKITS
jgi:hypothetical protein